MRRIVFGEWTLTPASGELVRGGETVRLQEQVLQVLLALLERPGQIVTREELIARLWPQVVVDYDTSLKSIVRKLRIVLGDAAEEPRYVETLPRKGYRFIGTVAEDHAVPSSAAGAAPAAAAPADTAKGVRLRWGSGRWLMVAAVAVVVAVAAGVTLRPSQPLRLAVLPFESSSPDSDAFFVDSLYEEVVTALRAGAPELEVVPRATMMSYRGRPNAIASELGATHVLEGVVRREADAVRFTVELMEAGGRHLWSQSYERRLRNSMTLQTEVAAAVAAQLAVKLSNRGGGLAPSPNFAAHDAYSYASFAIRSLDQRTPAQEVQQAEAWLDRAIELDDTFAAAYVRRAELKLSKHVLNHDVSEQNRDAARRDVERARSLAGDAVAVVLAHSRYLALFDRGPDRALEALDTLELGASREPEVLQWRGFYLCRAGRCNEGLAAYALAAKIDPGNPAIVSSWERELWALGRPLEALDVVLSYNRRHISPLDYGDLAFAFTGETEQLRRDLEGAPRPMAADIRLQALFDLWRYEGRAAELGALVAGFAGDTVRVGGFREYGLPGVGMKPVAELRGWAELLAGEDATDAGRAVIDFVAAETPTTYNQWYLRMLRAEGELFLGHRERAIEGAQDALRRTPRPFDFVTLYSRMLAARIYAWAGAPDDALALLERLAAEPPSLGPAEIVRDPLFDEPLASHPAYQALKGRLEGDIERNRAAIGAKLRDSRAAPR